jgi:hypothetical protein
MTRNLKEKANKIAFIAGIIGLVYPLALGFKYVHYDHFDAIVMIEEVKSGIVTNEGRIATINICDNDPMKIPSAPHNNLKPIGDDNPPSYHVYYIHDAKLEIDELPKPQRWYKVRLRKSTFRGKICLVIIKAEPFFSDEEIEADKVENGR